LSYTRFGAFVKAGFTYQGTQESRWFSHPGNEGPRSRMRCTF